MRSNSLWGCKTYLWWRISLGRGHTATQLRRHRVQVNTLYSAAIQKQPLLGQRALFD